MVKINRNNYEEYFIDFLDEKLNSSENKEVLLFLDLNPDLKEELELLKDELVIENETVFSNKQELKRTNVLAGVSESNLDELCIARIEKDLTVSEEVELERFLQEDAKKQKQLDLYRLTKLVKDESIVFPNKASLKKKSRILSRNFYIISAAASFILLVAWYVFIPKTQNENINNQLTDVKKESIENSANIPVHNKVAEVEVGKKEPILNLNIETKLGSSKQELKELKESIKMASLSNYTKESISKLVPLSTNLDYENPAKQLAQVKILQVEELNVTNDNETMSLRSFLASRFNQRVLNKEEKERIELFDIAQAGVNGINRLTGSNMSLERKYDENGIPDKTEFTSKLIAFSAPVKKD